MLKKLGHMLTDKRFRWRTAIGLTVLLSAVVCAITFFILSFTPLSPRKGIDGFQIGTIISLKIAFVAHLYVGNLVLTHDDQESTTGSDGMQSQIQAIYDEAVIVASFLPNQSTLSPAALGSPSNPVASTSRPRRDSNASNVVHHFANICFLGKRVWLTRYELDVAYALIRIQKLFEEQEYMLRMTAIIVRRFFAQWQ